MAMILFAPTKPRTAESPPTVRRSVVHRFTVPESVARPASTVPSPSSPVTSASAIDWDLEKQRVAGSVLQPPATRAFGAPPRSEVAPPRPNQPVHKAGESYRDQFGDTYYWLSANCYILSEAPDLAAPEAFKHIQPTRGGCIPHGPGEGEMFKDLPEYKKRHPQ